jgi:glycosyltransferase involved in cell wall biosynthesis
MIGGTLASIIINNYNHARFLREAIESALGQSYPRTEVIVVDDGSTDRSQNIIAEYGGRIVPVLKENGGQASACNAGFAVSRGRVVFYLDADDLLLPTAVEEAVARFDKPDVVKAHWLLAMIDDMGRLIGQTVPGSAASLPDGNLREVVIRDGPASCCSPPMSGNAWSRDFLAAILPIPEEVFRFGADAYLYGMAPFYGHIRAVRTLQGLYRRHGQSHSQSATFHEYLKFGLKLDEYVAGVALQYCRARGLEVEADTWTGRSWWHRVRAAVDEIKALVSSAGSFILVDDARLGMDSSIARHPIPFLERDGQYWGLPADDATAIRELERLRRAGAGHIVFAWPAFWWLDHYAGFHRYLRSRFPCVLENERLVAFDLTASSARRVPLWRASVP